MKCADGDLDYDTREAESGVSQLGMRGTGSESKRNLLYMFTSVLYKFHICAIYREKAVVAWRAVTATAILIACRKITARKKIAAHRRVWLCGC